jgi:hypothetical protein
MEEALIAKLLADGGVSGLVGTRVYPVARPQGSLLPAIVLATVSNVPVYTNDGEAGIAEARVQIDCWGATYGSVKAAARAVTASLSAFFGTVDDAVFQYVLLDGERDSRESGSNAPEYLFRTQLDFRVWYEN